MIKARIRIFAVRMRTAATVIRFFRAMVLRIVPEPFVAQRDRTMNTRISHANRRVQAQGHPWFVKAIRACVRWD